jgi:hypothetical protein
MWIFLSLRSSGHLGQAFFCDSLGGFLEEIFFGVFYVIFCDSLLRILYYVQIQI